MSDKVYQLNSNQIGVIQFNETWLFVHISLDGEKTAVNEFFPSITEAIKKFPATFKENVINVWKAQGAEGLQKIENLRNYLLKTWWNPGIETMRKALYEQYGAPEFRDRTGEDLVKNEEDFLSLVVAHIALRLNNKHFWFDGLHVSTRVVDKFLSVNFWDKLKNDVINQMGTTVIK